MTFPPAVLTLGALGAVHLLAVISPGPAFLTITRVAASRSRRAALGSVLGTVSAALLWATAAALGLHWVLARVGWVYGALKLVGGLWLVWLGLQAWRHAGVAAPAAEPGARGTGPTRPEPVGGFWEDWRLGLLANLSNPKMIVFFGSIFVSILTPHTPPWVRVAALVIVAVNESAWYTLVALVFSAPPAQRAYRRARRGLERVTGTVMMLFGLRLVADVRS